MKMLELYCGTKSISNAFKRAGWETYTVDWNPDFKPTRIMDISRITISDIEDICGGMPNVIWASPDCTTYSIAGISKHRTNIGGLLYPKSEYARFCDNANINLAHILRDFNGLYFVENPRGGMRKMGFWDAERYTISYCQYGDFRQKPTDIWTNHPNPQFKPCCKPRSPCHISAPRGSRTGSQGMDKVNSARIPDDLAKHIVNICDEYFYYKR